MNNPVARIMDVNLNRAGEALRTLEEYARFVQSSPALSQRCKQARHSLVAAAREWNRGRAPADQPVMNRDIVGDVGAGIKTEAEGQRPDALAVATAAGRRAAEALRALSEFAKTENRAAAALFEKIRYELYDIEPALLADATLRRRLTEARLGVEISSRASGAVPPATIAREALDGGADLLLLRIQEAGDGLVYGLAGELAELARLRQATLIVTGGRPHLAALVDAGGVYGGPDDLPVHLARRLIGMDKLVGCFVHLPENAEKALRDGADFLGVGPLFSGSGQTDEEAMACIKWAAEWGRMPFFATGGIDRDTLPRVLETGARAVIVGHAVSGAADIAGAAAFFKDRLREGSARA